MIPRTRLHSLLRLFHPFSSGGPAEECAALRRSAFRRPVTLRPRLLPLNSCSFIGSVARPVRRYDDGLGVYTFLVVNPPPSPLPSFRILLAMENELAEVSLKYLKINDFIYVCGPLGSYARVDGCGKCQILYKVFVKELNYVRHHVRNQIFDKPESSETEELTPQISSAFDQDKTSLSCIPDDDMIRRDRLHLWQLFFSNPSEWWDNRSSKLNPSSPDFKHRGTRECLWLSPEDPPWVRKQLQLYDTKMAEGYRMNFSGRSCDHEWHLKDFM